MKLRMSESDQWQLGENVPKSLNAIAHAVFISRPLILRVPSAGGSFRSSHIFFW